MEDVCCAGTIDEGTHREERSGKNANSLSGCSYKNDQQTIIPQQLDIIIIIYIQEPIEREKVDPGSLGLFCYPKIHNKRTYICTSALRTGFVQL